MTTYALSVKRECIRDRVLNTALSSGRGWACFKDLLDGFIYIKDHVSHSDWKSGAKSLETTSQCYLRAVFSSVYAWFAVKGRGAEKPTKGAHQDSTSPSASPIVVLGPVCTSWGY